MFLFFFFFFVFFFFFFFFFVVVVLLIFFFFFGVLKNQMLQNDQGMIFGSGQPKFQKVIFQPRGPKLGVFAPA